MTPTLLQTTWFILILVLFAGYAILDGFDLGVGMLLPWLARDEKEKRALFNAIGPIWDGNEVWLLAGAGALFAAFPAAYATIFSGFYVPLMLILFGLIFRAVALEFWLYDETRRRFWEYALIAGTFVPSFLFGVAIATLVQGITLDGQMNFVGGFPELLRPFPLITGALTVIAFALHGALFISFRCSSLAGQATHLAQKLSSIFFSLFELTAIAFVVFCWPRFLANLHNARFWIFFILTSGGVASVWFFIRQQKLRNAFFGMCLFLTSLWATAGSLVFPYIVPSGNPNIPGLSIMTASSSPLTLQVMFVIALLGMPLVIGYTVFVFRVFSKQPIVLASSQAAETLGLSTVTDK